MMIEPQQEHLWLQKLAGEWTFEGEALMGPDKPAETFNGRERARLIGNVWVVSEGEGEVPGGGLSKTMMTLGFDPQKQRFVGTFLGSMMTHMWIYDGSLDAAQKVLTLDTEGPGMSGDGKYIRYRDTITIESEDQRTMTSHYESEDGTWTQLMTMRYQRVG